MKSTDASLAQAGYLLALLRSDQGALLLSLLRGMLAASEKEYLGTSPEKASRLYELRGRREVLEDLTSLDPNRLAVLFTKHKVT